MQIGGTQRLQLEDNVTIMKLARINDERERNIPYSILWSVESRRPFNTETEWNKLRSKFVEKENEIKLFYKMNVHVQFLILRF